MFLESLSKFEYEVFINYAKGLCTSEVSRLMNISERQVQSAHDRCRQKLKAKILID